LGCPPAIGLPTPTKPPGRVAASASNLPRISTNEISVSNIGIFNSDGGVVVLPSRELDCFCLDLFATGGAKTTGPVGNQLILPFVDGIDLVDIKPDAIENMIECYALLALNQGILPSIGQMISKFAFSIRFRQIWGQLSSLHPHLFLIILRLKTINLKSSSIWTR